MQSIFYLALLYNERIGAHYISESGGKEREKEGGKRDWGQLLQIWHELVYPLGNRH